MGKQMGADKTSDRAAEKAAEIDPDTDDAKEFETAWDDEIAEWEADDRFENTSLKISVYRQPLRGGEREKVWEFNDEIISTHEIGVRFGGGRYSTYGRIVQDGKIVKTIRRTFRLSESSYPLPQAVPQQVATMTTGAAPMTFENIMRMIQASLPVIVALKEVFGGGGNKLAAMEEAQKVVGRVIEESGKREIALLKSIRSETVNNGEQAKAAAASTEEDPAELKTYLLDVLKEYGPGLIEAVGLRLRGATAVIKNDPVFQTLARNEALFTKVYSLLTKDPELKEEEKVMIENVLTKIASLGLGIKIPRPTHVNGTRPQGAPA